MPLSFVLSSVPVITIDGPSGSGKGTLSLMLARALGWHFLDSGALYRALAVAAGRNGVNLEDELGLERLALNLPLSFHEFQIFLEGDDITRELRQESTGNLASQVSVFPKVRRALLARQRAFLQPPGLVADGRDMGTVIFPEAPLKIYLEASLEERAKRRFHQLKEGKSSVKMEALLQEIAERDARDRARVVAPLQPAPDAKVIDTTGVDIASVFSQVMQAVERQWPHLKK